MHRPPTAGASFQTRTCPFPDVVSASGREQSIGGSLPANRLTQPAPPSTNLTSHSSPLASDGFSVEHGIMPLRQAPKKRRSSDVPDAPARPVERNLNETDFKHDIFTQWSQECGVEIHNVRPANILGRGIGLVATARIERDARILFVPEKAMFKPDAGRLGKSTFQELQRCSSPQALLAICLAMECDHPSTALSKWKATWPDPRELLPSLPLHWSADMLDMLPRSVEAPLQRLRDDYRKDREIWLTSPDGDPDREEDFEYYWAIVNSRSFHFKPPGAKPAHMVLCPFIDYINHGPSGTGVTVKQSPKGYEVTADRCYNEGEEILATYGAHPNDKLLVHYGFINPSTDSAPSDDDIRLDHLLVPALGEATCESLQDVGYLGGYALLPASNEVCFKTQVAVRAKLLTASEWEYFIANGEDLSGDHCDRVRQFLVAEVMEPFLAEARDRLGKLEKLDVDSRSGRTRNADKQVAWGLLRQRWSQIRDGLQMYMDGD